MRALPVDPLPVAHARAVAEGSGALQDGLAALAFRTVFDSQGRGPAHRGAAPPVDGVGHRADLYLDLAQRLLGGGYATPQSLIQSTSEENRAPQSVSPTPRGQRRGDSATVTTEVARINAAIRDLLVAMDGDKTSAVDPIELLAPLQYGLLRAMSTAWRGDDDQAREWVDNADEQIDGLLDLVTVTDPGRPLSLASGDSPIQVSMSNGLPVAIEVRINLNASAGLRPTSTRCSPSRRGGITRYIPAEVVRAGRFTVDARLSTPAGTHSADGAAGTELHHLRHHHRRRDRRGGRSARPAGHRANHPQDPGREGRSERRGRR